MVGVHAFLLEYLGRSRVALVSFVPNPHSRIVSGTDGDRGHLEPRRRTKAMWAHTLARHFQKSIRRRGVLKTAMMTPLAGLLKLKEISRAWNPRCRRAMQADREFDRTYGIDTSQTVELASLDIPHDSWVHGVWYQPIGPGEFRDLLRITAIPFEEYTFIDFGAGKGRALVLASEYPFRRIIGVEFSPELCEIAARNVQTLRAPAQRCNSIEIVNDDALRYQLPNEPLVLYLYNPFGPAVMKPLVSQIEMSWRHCTRPIIVLYHTPHCADVWRRSSVFVEIVQRPELSVFKTIAPDAARSLKGLSTD